MSNPTLYPGRKSNSRYVYQLQRLLRQRGYSMACFGHTYGAALAREVKRYQAQHGLAVDGIVGPNTWASLLRPVEDTNRTGLGSPGEQALGDWRIPTSRHTPAPQSRFDRMYLLSHALADYDAGLQEVPLGSNKCPWLEPRAQGKPWCSFQVHTWIRSVIGKWIFGGRRGSTRVDLAQATARELLTTSPQPGDVFVLCDDTGRAYHTGLVLRVGQIYTHPNVRVDAYNTVEGNSNNRVAVRERVILPTAKFWRVFPAMQDGDWAPGLLPGVKKAGGESTR